MKILKQVESLLAFVRHLVTVCGVNNERSDPIPDMEHLQVDILGLGDRNYTYLQASLGHISALHKKDLKGHRK